MLNLDLKYFESSDFLTKEKIFLEKNNLVKLEPNDNLIIKVPYAQTSNFCNAQLYSHPFIYLHRDAYKNIQKVLTEAKKLGYKIKIWDGFRPYEAQSFMADKYPKFVEDGFVSHPKNGIATHIRGIAVDLTLTDQANNELDMGTEFDEMTSKAHHNSSEISLLQKTNRQILIDLMTKKADFEIYDNEWWHFNLKIFKRDKNGEIIGAISTQEEIYPKITQSFPELLSPEVQEFYHLHGQNYHTHCESIFFRIRTRFNSFLNLKNNKKC